MVISMVKRKTTGIKYGCMYNESLQDVAEDVSWNQ